MRRIVLVRHGQSTWNKENRFTGWTDVPLTNQGIEEAMEAGRNLKDEGFEFTIAYTSYLKRAIKSLWLALEQMDRMWIDVHRSWRLNEKHYGALQGLNKKETAEEHGDEQVLLWRRSFDSPPPALEENDSRSPAHDPRYAALSKEELPMTEALKHTIDRTMPYWEEQIVPAMKEHKDILVFAHGNSLRGIVKSLKGMNNEEIISFNLPTGIPYVFEFDDEGKQVKDYFIGDPVKIKKLQEAVANQAK